MIARTYKINLVQIIIVISDCISCRAIAGATGSTGDVGATGPTGATGSTGSVALAGLYNYNSSGGNVTISSGSPFTFNQTAVSFGSGISQSDTSTFVISEAGTYFVQFTAQTATLSLLGSAQIYLNENPIAAPNKLLVGGAPLILFVLVQIDASDLPASLQVRAGGTLLTLTSGGTNSICISQWSN